MTDHVRVAFETSLIAPGEEIPVVRGTEVKTYQRGRLRTRGFIDGRGKKLKEAAFFWRGNLFAGLRGVIRTWQFRATAL